MEGMAKYLPTIFSYFISNMSDDMPEMRCISCWVLSRYSVWLFEQNENSHDDANYDTSSSSPQNNEEMKHQLFVSSLHSLCQAMLDSNPKLQAAACSALSTVLENAAAVDRDLVLPYTKEIFQVVSQCFRLPYGVKSGMLLIDLVGTLADCLGEELYNLSQSLHSLDPSATANTSSNNMTSLYLPYVLQKFYSYADDDMYLFPVLECLASVTAAVRLDMLPYAKDLLTRCLHIINKTMTLNAAYEAGCKLKGSRRRDHERAAANSHEDEEDEELEYNDVSDVPVKDFAICSLDVIGGLCEGLGNYFVVLVSENNFSDMLISLIINCSHDSLSDLRQSSISLAGEISKSASALFSSPIIQTKVVELMLLNLDEEYESCCNNAVWALGEIAMKYGGQVMQPYLGRIMNQLLSLMHLSELNSSIQQNMGVLLGRLCCTNTATMIELIIAEYFNQVCCYWQLVPAQGVERNQTYQGIVAVLMMQPAILLSDVMKENSPRGGNNRPGLVSFLSLCSTWEDPPDEPLLSQLSSLLCGVKQTLGAERWQYILSQATAAAAAGGSTGIDSGGVGLSREAAMRVIDMFRIK